MQIVPESSSCFNISISRLLGVCVFTTSRSTSSTSTNRNQAISLQTDNSTFFWQKHRQKMPLRIYKTRHLKWKKHFLWTRGVACPDPPSMARVPLPHPTLLPAKPFECAPLSYPPEFQTDSRNWPASLRLAASKSSESYYFGPTFSLVWCRRPWSVTRSSRIVRRC